MNFFRSFFAISPSAVKKIVVISPIVYPKQFEKISGLKGKHYKSILGYLIANFKAFTYVKTPMTQSAVADLMVLLKKTKCREVYFIGAVGGLEPGLKIGDILVTEKAKEVYSFSSIHDETAQKLKALRKKGVLGIDFESRVFFQGAKKAKLDPLACYVVTDLPLSRPFYKPKTQKEKNQIQSCLHYIIKLIAATVSS